MAGQQVRKLIHLNMNIIRLQARPVLVAGQQQYTDNANSASRRLLRLGRKLAIGLILSKGFDQYVFVKSKVRGDDAMVLKRGQGACCLSNKVTSLFSTFLLFSTSLTPATFVFSTAARADDVHAVCITPDETITVGNNPPQTEDLSDPNTTVAYIKQFNSTFLDSPQPGFVRVANDGGPPTFRLSGSLNFITRDSSNNVTNVQPATLGDLKLTNNTLTYAEEGPIPGTQIQLGAPFSSTAPGDAGKVGTVSAGSIGLPVLSTVEATNTEVQDLIRQRRELAATSATMSVAAVDIVQAEASPPLTSAPVKPSVPNNAKAFDAAVDGNGIVIDYDSLPSQGAWAQAFADYERHDGLAPGSGENLVRKQTTVGGMSGADTTYRRITEDGLETFQFGLLGGGTHITSNFSDFGNVTNARQTQDGGFVGAYGTYRHNNFSVDGFFKADLLTLRQRSTISGPVKCDPGQVLVIDETPNALESTTHQNGKVDEYTYTVGGNAYYRFDLDNGAYFEPLIGFIFSATNYGNGATNLGLDNGQMFRLQGGARLGKSWDDDQNRTWSIALLGMLYSDLYVNGYSLEGLGLPPGASEVDEGKLRVLGQLEGSVNLNNGLSLNGTIGVRGGQDVVGVGGRLGARLEW